MNRAETLSLFLQKNKQVLYVNDVDKCPYLGGKIIAIMCAGQKLYCRQDVLHGMKIVYLYITAC